LNPLGGWTKKPGGISKEILTIKSPDDKIALWDLEAGFLVRRIDGPGPRTKKGGPVAGTALRWTMESAWKLQGVTTRMKSRGSAKRAAGTVTVICSTGLPLSETGVTAGVKLSHGSLSEVLYS
jgi:hypothetical protein